MTPHIIGAILRHALATRDNGMNTVTYRATSAFTDPITIINVIALSLVSEDVRAIIPTGWLPYVTALIAVFNIVMQVAPIADRPVRLNIAPGTSRSVTLPKLD